MNLLQKKQNNYIIDLLIYIFHFIRMDKNLVFIKPIEWWNSKKNDEKNWFKSKSFFDQKKYKESIKNLFYYLDKKNFKKYKVKGEEKYIIPNYKNWVELEIKDKKLYIKMDVVKIEEKDYIYIWRQLLDLNRNLFILPKLSIYEGIVTLTYFCYLDSAAPWKISKCLSEIWQFSFYYTEKFVNIYNWILTKEPNIIYYKENEYQCFLEKIIFIINQADEYCNYFENKLEYWYAWDVCLQSILNIDVFLSPKWILKKELDEIIDLMRDMNKTKKECLFLWINFLNKLKELTVDDLKKSVYKCDDILYKRKYYSDYELISYLWDSLYSWKQQMLAENFIWLTLYTRWWLISSLYNINIESKEYYNRIIKNLLCSSSKPWKKSWRKLYWLISNIVNLRGTNKIIYFIICYIMFILVVNVISTIYKQFN